MHRRIAADSHRVLLSNNGARTQECSVQVHGNAATPVFVIEIFNERRRATNTRTINQHIDVATEVRARVVNRSLNVILVCDVGDGAAKLFVLADERCNRVGVHVCNVHPRTGFQERLSDGLSDAGAASCNQNAL